MVIHTTLGMPSTVEKGIGPDKGYDYQIVKFYQDQAKCNGAHGGIDTDGSLGWYADALTEAAYHARSLNEVSIGLEIKQLPILDRHGKIVGGRVWECQLETAARVVDALCPVLGIQRQFHGPYGKPVPRLVAGGKDCVGAFGHRDQTDTRGKGDPGDEVFKYLRDLGFTEYNFARNHDKVAWITRQAVMSAHGFQVEVDGVPGPGTVAALKKAGYHGGLWVPSLRSQP